MDIERLENRIDLETVLDHVGKGGWEHSQVGQDIQVFPTTDSNSVLISRVRYKFCGAWILPIYSRVDLETYIDISTISSTLLQIALTEIGSLSVLRSEEDDNRITILYRLFIPADGDHVQFSEGVLTAYFSMVDLREWVKNIHRV